MSSPSSPSSAAAAPSTAAALAHGHAPSSRTRFDVLLPKGWRGGVSFAAPEGFTWVKGKLQIPEHLVVSEVAKVAFSSKRFNARKQLDEIETGDRVVAVNGLPLPGLASAILDDGSTMDIGGTLKNPPANEVDEVDALLATLEALSVSGGGGASSSPRLDGALAGALPSARPNKMSMDMSLDDIMGASKQKAGEDIAGKKGKKGKGKKGGKGKKDNVVGTVTAEVSTSAATSTSAPPEVPLKPPSRPPAKFSVCHRHPVRKHRIGDIGKFDDDVCSSCDFLRTLRQSGPMVAIPLWIRAVKDDDDTRITLTMERD